MPTTIAADHADLRVIIIEGIFKCRTLRGKPLNLQRVPLPDFETLLRCRSRMINGSSQRWMQQQPVERNKGFRGRACVSLAVVSLVLLAFSRPGWAQEFNCTVQFTLANLSGGSDYTFLSDLRTDLEEYINQTVWTEDRFDPDERIECGFNVQFVEAITLTRFRASVVITSKRPVYGSSQETRIVTIADQDWIFEYAQGNPIVSNLDRFDELTTFIDYYLFILLGYDYDTFAELGGTAYFERARRLADLGKSRSGSGWSDLAGERSRPALVKELLDPRFKDLRSAYFRYHYEGLDQFIRDPNTARDNVLDILGQLRDLADGNARSYAIDLFFSAKSEELASLFLESVQSGPAYDLLSEVDGAHLSSYSRLIN